MAEFFGHGEPVAVVETDVVEGAAFVGGGEGADGAVAFGPVGSVVGSEEAFGGAFVGGFGVGCVGDGEEGGVGCCCEGYEE